MIRVATADDKEAVWGIIEAVIAGGDTYVFEPGTPREAMLEYWFAPEKSVFVAEEGGEIVGTYWIKANQPGLGDHVCNAAYMVSPAAHGKGIGRRMAEHSLDEARGLGYKALQFNFVVASNTAAVRLWESIGMRIIGTIPNAFRHRTLGFVDAYIMFRKL